MTSRGHASLNPATTYCVDGAMARPRAWFSLPPAAEVYVRDGYVNETMALLSWRHCRERRRAS